MRGLRLLGLTSPLILYESIEQESNLMWPNSITILLIISCHGNEFNIFILYSYNHYFCFFQEGDPPKKAATSVAVPQPCIIVRGTLESISTSFLVIEREIYCEIPPNEAVIALLCAFYVYNIEYTPGCSNTFAFFESVFFNNTAKGTRRRLATLMSQLFPKTEN